jgi:hypothetical protein
MLWRDLQIAGCLLDGVVVLLDGREDIRDI